MKTKKHNKLSKTLLIICLLIVSASSLYAWSLEGDTDDAQLFGEAISAGDYYLCNSILEDPDVEIDLKNDFNDLLYKHVFKIYNEQNNANPYYIRVEPLKIAELLMTRGLTTSNLTIWDLYPQGWSPEAEQLARKIYKENNYDMESWLKSAASYSNEYYNWFEEEYPESYKTKPEKEAQLLSMKDLTDEELLIQLKRFYDGIHNYECALEETRRRCAVSSFALIEEIFQIYDEIKDEYDMLDKKMDMERILYLAGDKRIIPGLLKEGYKCSYEPGWDPHTEVSYLVKQLDKNLYDVIFTNENRTLSNNDLTALADLLTPYYTGETNIIEIISNTSDVSSKVSTLAVKYASTQNSYSEYLTSHLIQFEEDLRFGSGEVRYNAISNLAMTDDGQTFLHDYIFKTWDPQIFSKISELVELPDTAECREHLKTSFIRWNERDYCYDKDDIIEIMLKQLIRWEDDDFFDYISNTDCIDSEKKSFSILAECFEGKNAMKILNEHSPFENRRYYIERYFPYIHHDSGRIQVVDDKRYTALYFNDLYSQRSDESLRLPYIEALAEIQPVSNYFCIIEPDKKLVVTDSLKKPHPGFLQGVIKLEANAELNLAVIDSDGNIIGQILISNNDSVDCWRNFRIPVRSIETNEAGKELYLRTSTGEALIIPELKLFLNI